MRHVLIFILVLAPFLSYGQKYGVSIESGQSYGVFKKNLNDAPKSAAIRHSLGSGICGSALFHLYPDSSNWYFSAGIEVLQGRQTNTSETLTSDSFDYRISSATLNTLRFQAQLAYSFNLRWFHLDVRAGVTVPLLSKNKEDFYTKDSLNSSVTATVVKSFPALGFKGGVTLNREILRGVKFFLNLDVTVLNQNVKSRKVVSYWDNFGGTMDEVYPGVAYREMLYHKDPSLVRNNESVLPSSFKKDTPTDKLTYLQSMSSLNFKAGFLFLF